MYLLLLKHYSLTLEGFTCSIVLLCSRSSSPGSVCIPILLKRYLSVLITRSSFFRSSLTNFDNLKIFAENFLLIEKDSFIIYFKLKVNYCLNNCNINTCVRIPIVRHVVNKVKIVFKENKWWLMTRVQYNVRQPRQKYFFSFISNTEFVLLIKQTLNIPRKLEFLHKS